MSLGTYNSTKTNSRGKNEAYSPTTYSSIRFYNDASTVDPSSLTFAFWKGLLKISITPIKIKQGSPSELDRDNVIDLYLSPLKARLFADYISEFVLKNQRLNELGGNVGVNTNKGLIYISDGSEFDKAGTYFLVIKHVSEEGAITSEIAYEFTENYYAIAGYAGGYNFNKNSDLNTFFEVKNFLNVLTSYANSATNAIAASVVDNMSYGVNSMQSKLKSIQEKLGIDTSKKGGNFNRSSFFDNTGDNHLQSPSNGGGSSTEQYESYDNLMDDLG